MDDKANTASPSEFVASLTDFTDGIAGQPNFLAANGQSAQLSSTATLQYNLRNWLISNDRNLLSRLYVEHGIIQTLVDQPVEDGFRAGFDIHTGQLSADEISQVLKMWDRDGVGYAVMQACKWARLFGGGSVLLITDQPPGSPLNWDKINDKSRIAFRGVDLWELYRNQAVARDGTPENTAMLDPDVQAYNYYGVSVHPSRVLPIRGKEAPSFIRSMLRGWGMSEVEKVVRSLNQYLKNQDVVFELLDEAKVDIFRIKGLNEALATSKGTEGVLKRTQNANMIKNFINALVMDMGDEYDQKSMAFTGLAEMLREIRIGIAADLKMPVTKLFGISSAGFNSGEDDIENYNAMIESEVRAKAKHIVEDMLGICCQRLFGFRPDDLHISWPTLRMMKATEVEQVKEKQAARVTQFMSTGLIDANTATMAINKDKLVGVEVPEITEALPMPGDDPDEKKKEGKNASKRT